MNAHAPLMISLLKYPTCMHARRYSAEYGATIVDPQATTTPDPPTVTGAAMTDAAPRLAFAVSAEWTWQASSHWVKFIVPFTLTVVPIVDLLWMAHTPPCPPSGCRAPERGDRRLAHEHGSVRWP